MNKYIHKLLMEFQNEIKQDYTYIRKTLQNQME